MQIMIHQWAFPGSFEQLSLLPRQEFFSDWFGQDVTPPAQFSFATDGTYLWFLAERSSKAYCHPAGSPGSFQPELWKYDVAEWFLASKDNSGYWEFNLAPNGAWWACSFSDIRKPNEKQPVPENVETQSIKDEQGGWTTMAKIPLSELAGIDIRNCRLATAFILNSPEQIFITSALDLSGEPDFHRPSDFSPPILK